MNRDNFTNITIRQLNQGEEAFLKEMLFESIYLPSEEKLKLHRDIIFHSDLRIYYEHWGRHGDLAIVAVSEILKNPVGCAWGRLYKMDNKGYGYISDKIPELSIAVDSDFRNKGVGTELLKRLIEAYQKSGFQKLSLSVSKKNPSIHLYEREQFKIFHENENDIVMQYDADAIR
jgi:ribosomal protein S18 acetylase RimI-like enzyme